MAQGPVTGSDNAVGWVILIVLAICIALLIWMVAEYEIKSVIRWIRWGEMWVVSWFLSSDYTVIDHRGRELNFHDMLEIIPEIPYKKLTGEVMSIINTVALAPLRWVYGGLFGILAIWAMMNGPETKYRRKLNLDGLINAQSKIFPVIKPFVKFNPSDQPIRPPGSPVPSELPLFAEALGPEEWLAYNQIPVPDGEIDAEAAAEMFAEQLGAPWRGAQNLPDYKKALLAAFCLKAARKRSESDDLLSEIAECWEFECGLKLSSAVMSSVNKILRDKELTKTALDQANRHAFQTTALMRALQTAREQGGVLAPAQFVWLRGYDRALWYPLNNLGRHTFHMESMGAVSHYREERITDRPIPKPKVEIAVKTIVEYMSGLSARPIPQLDYSKSSKSRGVKKPKGAPKSAGIKKPKAPVRP